MSYKRERHLETEKTMKKARRRLLTSSVLITASTAAIYMINKMISASAVLRNLLSFGESDFYEWRFGRVYYKKYGENGDPVLLIHDLNVYGNDYEFSKIVHEIVRASCRERVDV